MAMNKAVARLESQVRRAIRECDLAGGKRLVVAVSGGPDSLALVHALSRLAGDLDLDLHGAHLDHGLRGSASAADSLFVAETFGRLRIPFTAERADVPSFRRRRRLSPEQAAREVRYAFLARVAARESAQAVAVGHTSDDQAETVLMHIVRGSGLAGLRGMEISTRLTFGGNELRVVRPLLRSTKNETVAYCRALDLEPRLDQSNLSAVPSRNRVRLEVLPLLERLNPRIREALLGLSRNAAQAAEYLNAAVDGLPGDSMRRSEVYLALSRDVLKSLDPAVRAHLLRRAVARFKGDLTGIEQEHIEKMAQLAGGTAGKGIDLPGGLRFMVGYQEVALTPQGTDLCPLPHLDGEHPFGVPGRVRAGRWLVAASVVERVPDEAIDGSWTGAPRDRPVDAGRLWRSEFGQMDEHAPVELRAYLNCDALDGLGTVRGRRPGDRFQPRGMTGTKTLQDFMVDAKIPRQWRDRVPLVVSHKGVAWVAGWRVADWAKVRGGDARHLELSLTQDDDV